MILPNCVIEELSEGHEKKLITPFKKEHLRSSSYDLTVGDEYYIGSNERSASLVTQKLKPKQSFTIPPHAICFILTKEAITLPLDVTAKVSLRMTHIYAGMVLTSQPPFDPEYDGKVVVMIHNLSSTAVHLKSGDRIATIEFVRLESPPKNPRAHRSVRTLEEQLEKPLKSSLTKIANDSDVAKKRVTWLAGQMLAFATLVVASLALPGLYSYNSMSSHIDEQRAQIKDMNQLLATYEKEIKKNRDETESLKSQLAALNTAPIIAQGESTPFKPAVNGAHE